jgi:hypothetical protein
VAFVSTEAWINPQPISSTSTTAKVPVGTVVRAEDKDSSTALGVGEFIYCSGVASTVVGSVVSIDEAAATTLASANAKGRVGVAMSINVASQYGWYQISGKAHAKVLASFADNGVCYLTSTAGSVDDADVGGDLVKGMIGRSAVSGGLAYVECNRPFVDDSADD